MAPEGLLVLKRRKEEGEQLLLVVAIRATGPRHLNGVVDRTVREHCVMLVAFVSCCIRRGCRYTNLSIRLRQITKKDGVKGFERRTVEAET